MGRPYRHKPGDIVGGWTLKSRLGIGGNGEVWLVRRDRQTAAMKIVTAPPGSDRANRFRDEVTLHRKLGTRPGILPMIDSDLDGNPTWMLMPRAEKLIHTLGGAPALRAVVEAIASIASTLADLADEDIAHRDVKPDNLFQLNGCWVCGDLGLATFPEKPDRTETGTLGPALFIAPEMVTGANRVVDARPADVYSLAKVLFALAADLRFPVPGQLSTQFESTRLSNLVHDPRAILLDGLLAGC